MKNRSLILFITLSVAAHAAVVGTWPEMKQVVPQAQDCSIEIGMVAMPRIDRDFTRDRSRLQQLAQVLKKQKTKQKNATSSIKLAPDTTSRRIDIQTSNKVSGQTLAESITENIITNVALTSVSTIAPDQNNNPLTASKAAPLYAINPAPDYPVNALRYGWEGEVWLKVIVNRSGAVGKIEIERSSAYRVLDQAAMNTVRHWQFEPARIGNKSTEGVVSIPIRFRINRS